jgi:hypothetical protein
MWCRSAVNRNFLSFSAAWRTRSCALGASFRLGVRDAFCCGRFPLARPLPSIPPPPVVRHCSGTSQVLRICPTSQVRSSSDCVLRLPDASQSNCNPWANLGSPGSHARCLRTCSGSLTARDSGTPRDIGAHDGAFRFLLQRRRPGAKALTRFNTRPARSPVNASTTPLQAAPHDSRPMWVAASHSYDSCIHYTSAV